MSKTRTRVLSGSKRGLRAGTESLTASDDSNSTIPFNNRDLLSTSVSRWNCRSGPVISTGSAISSEYPETDVVFIEQGDEIDLDKVSSLLKMFRPKVMVFIALDGPLPMAEYVGSERKNIDVYNAKVRIDELANATEKSIKEVLDDLGMSTCAVILSHRHVSGSASYKMIKAYHNFMKSAYMQKGMRFVLCGEMDKFLPAAVGFGDEHCLIYDEGGMREKRMLDVGRLRRAILAMLEDGTQNISEDIMLQKLDDVRAMMVLQRNQFLTVGIAGTIEEKIKAYSKIRKEDASFCLTSEGKWWWWNVGEWLRKLKSLDVTRQVVRNENVYKDLFRYMTWSLDMTMGKCPSWTWNCEKFGSGMTVEMILRHIGDFVPPEEGGCVMFTKEEGVEWKYPDTAGILLAQEPFLPRSAPRTIQTVNKIFSVMIPRSGTVVDPNRVNSLLVEFRKVWVESGLSYHGMDLGGNSKSVRDVLYRIGKKAQFISMGVGDDVDAEDKMPQVNQRVIVNGCIGMISEVGVDGCVTVNRYRFTIPHEGLENAEPIEIHRRFEKELCAYRYELERQVDMSELLWAGCRKPIMLHVEPEKGDVCICVSERAFGVVGRVVRKSRERLHLMVSTNQISPNEKKHFVSEGGSKQCVIPVGSSELVKVCGNLRRYFIFT